MALRSCSFETWPGVASAHQRRPFSPFGQSDQISLFSFSRNLVEFVKNIVPKLAKSGQSLPLYGGYPSRRMAVDLGHGRLQFPLNFVQLFHRDRGRVEPHRIFVPKQKKFKIPWIALFQGLFLTTLNL